MTPKLCYRLFLLICLLPILITLASRIAQADEPIEGQAQKKVFLPILIKPQINCQFSNLLQNGSFENGVAPWVQQSALNYPIIGQSPNSYHGAWRAWLGGYNNANDILYQSFQVPAGCKALKIVLYLRITTSDSPTIRFDRLYASLQPPNNVSNPEVLVASNATDCDCTWMRMIYVYNQIPNPGQPLRLYIRANTDFALITNFFLDQISVEASGSSFPQPTLATDLQTSADGHAFFWSEPLTGEPPFPLAEEANTKQ